MASCESLAIADIVTSGAFSAYALGMDNQSAILIANSSASNASILALPM
jgi:hypothetical protein